MPRKPTGRPRGRPAGTGQLGEEGTGHKRLTVRLPKELYDALEAVAEHEHYTREAPELARTVRTALEHYLVCPHSRQTGIVPSASLTNNGQTGKVLETLEDDSRQTENIPEPLGDIRGQTENIPEPLGEDKRQTEIPPFDTTKYQLGKLCRRGHDYYGTGQTKWRLSDRKCQVCENERRNVRRARAKRQVQSV